MSLSVSVVMPSYNHAHFIREAIDSVLSQDYPSIELLVMDGGSDDGTVEILKSYGDRLRFVSQKDRGQSDALNQGLSRAQGDILCWLNSDDTFTSGAVATVVKAFEDHPDVDFIYGEGWTTDGNNRIVDRAGVLPFNRWKLINHRNFIQQPSCFFRRSLLQKAGLVDESLHYVMDWELWIRFSAYKPLFLNSYLSCNRTYAENKTVSGKMKRWREINRMIHRYTIARWPPVLSFYLLETVIVTLNDRPFSTAQVARWQSIADYLRVRRSISLKDRLNLFLFMLLTPLIRLSRLNDRLFSAAQIARWQYIADYLRAQNSLKDRLKLFLFTLLTPFIRLSRLNDRPFFTARIARWQYIADYLRARRSISLKDRLKLFLFTLLMPLIRLSRLNDRPFSTERIAHWQGMADYVRIHRSISLKDRLKLLLFALLMPLIRLSRWVVRVTASRLLRSLTESPEYSGHYDDGGIASTFHFSVGNPHGEHRQVCLRLMPLSHYAHSRLNGKPVRFRWTSSSGGHGEFALQENGQIQVQILPLQAQNIGGFEHFTCRSHSTGIAIDKRRRIIGFLDDIQVI